MATPNYSSKIICLANSRKTSGRCIAGKLIEGPEKGKGKWIRPVSSRASGELSEEDRRFKDGNSPALYDILSVPMKSTLAHPYQIENHLIDDGFYWSKPDQAGWNDLLPLIDKVTGPLWENHSSSTSGHNDRVNEARAAAAVTAFGGSLSLIHVKDLKVSVAIEGAAFNNAKRKVRGEFTYAGHHYRVAITDPRVEGHYLAQGDGDYVIGESLLCMSLGDAYNEYAYKLIAAVFFPPV